MRQFDRCGWALVLGLFVIAGAAIGCSGTESESGSPDSSDLPVLDAGIIAQADPRTVPQPLAAYTFNAAQRDVLDRATLITANRCMEQYGFAPQRTWRRPPINELWARYGLWDPTSATTGYLSPEELEISSAGMASYLPFVGEAQVVYFGQVPQYGGVEVPPGGCQAQVNAAVWEVEGVTDLRGFVSELYEEARERSRQDPRVQSLLEAWRTCMNEKGWDYEDVWSPFEYWSQPPRRGTERHVTLASISADEKASAKDDVACKHSTGLLGTWLAADIAYQQLIVERESQRLAEWSEDMAAILANANEIIANG